MASANLAWIAHDDDIRLHDIGLGQLDVGWGDEWPTAPTPELLLDAAE
jgi:hypothetical protein